MDNREIRASALRSAVLLLNDRQDVLSPDFASVLFSTAAAFENCIRHGFGGVPVEQPGAEETQEPETDERFRQRVLAVVGSHSVNTQRIMTDGGARLDEVAASYDLKRRGT